MMFVCLGTMKLEERELNPRDIVKHVVRTAIVACKDRGITIQADIGDDVPSVVFFWPIPHGFTQTMYLILCKICESM